MSGFFGGLWWFIVTLGVLVTFHEFGHYWVARRCGVKVLKFSVGFGRALWSRTAQDGTEYQIAMIPLGGYVKMLDEREVEVAPIDRDAAFNRQSVGKRIAIVAAGPIANLLLCVALFWASFIIGQPELAAVLGKPSGLAAQAGIQEGDRILQVDDQATPTWNLAAPALVLAAIDRRAITLHVRDTRGDVRSRPLSLDRLPADFDQTNPFVAIGFSAPSVPPVVGAIATNAAAQGQLQTGDRILSIGSRSINEFEQIGPALQAAAAQNRSVALKISREGRELAVTIAPKAIELEGKQVWQLGIASPAAETVLLRYGPMDALGAALRETKRLTRTNLAFLGRLFTGQASTKNLSGAIGIAQAAHSEANLGLARLLAFMAGLSLMLCIINLLPIPVLDGGHLLYYLIELVSGRAVSDRVLIAGQYAGLVVLAGLVLLANTNDILRLT